MQIPPTSSVDEVPSSFLEEWLSERHADPQQDKTLLELIVSHRKGDGVSEKDLLAALVDYADTINEEVSGASGADND